MVKLHLKTYFNTTMVQVEVILLKLLNAVIVKFQYHYGSSRRQENPEEKSKQNLFQYHYGSSRSNLFFK